MTTQIKSILLSMVVTITSMSGWKEVMGQINEHKNDIYVTGGLIPGVYGVATINYERWILNFNQNQKTYLTARMGYGVWLDWGGEGSVGTLNINFLSGKARNFFDVGLGAALFTDDDYPWVNPAFNIGYRYRSKSFVFRTGLSWPEALYLSLGISF